MGALQHDSFQVKKPLGAIAAQATGQARIAKTWPSLWVVLRSGRRTKSSFVGTVSTDANGPNRTFMLAATKVGFEPTYQICSCSTLQLKKFRCVRNGPPWILAEI